jgi:hypothetical protein
MNQLEKLKSLLEAEESLIKRQRFVYQWCSCSSPRDYILTFEEFQTLLTYLK